MTLKCENEKGNIGLGLEGRRYKNRMHRLKVTVGIILIVLWKRKLRPKVRNVTLRQSSVGIVFINL